MRNELGTNYNVSRTGFWIRGGRKNGKERGQVKITIRQIRSFSPMIVIIPSHLPHVSETVIYTSCSDINFNPLVHNMGCHLHRKLLRKKPKTKSLPTLFCLAHQICKIRECFPLLYRDTEKQSDTLIFKHFSGNCTYLHVRN